MRELNQSVVAELFKTIADSSHWQKALAVLCEEIGAQKAIITLRDVDTANLVIPTQVSEEHLSPLLYGFSENEVGAYLDEYVHVDPWTQYERVFRPFLPYALSKFISQPELKQTKFWPWLERQGINDTVVAEIGYSGKHWAAINLYFDNDSTNAVEGVVDGLTAYQDILQQVWRTGFSLTSAKATMQINSSIIDYLSDPAVLLDRNLIVLSCNTKATDALEAGLIEDLECGKRVRLCGSVERVSKDGFELGAADRTHGSSGGNSSSYVAVLSELNHVEDVVGYAHAHLLLTLVSKERNQLNTEEYIWNKSELTPNERVLARTIAEGGQIKDVENKLGISKSRTMQIWRCLRKKLDVRDKADLYARHQKHLANYT